MEAFIITYMDILFWGLLMIILLEHTPKTRVQGLGLQGGVSSGFGAVGCLSSVKFKNLHILCQMALAQACRTTTKPPGKSPKP